MAGSHLSCHFPSVVVFIWVSLESASQTSKLTFEPSKYKKQNAVYTRRIKGRHSLFVMIKKLRLLTVQDPGEINCTLCGDITNCYQRSVQHYNNKPTQKVLMLIRNKLILAKAI